MKSKITLLVASVLLFLYSALGIIQAALLSVAPGYSKERLSYNLVLWGSVAAASFGFSIYFSLRIYFAKKASRARNN